CRRRVKAPHIQAFLPDDTGAKKADARYDLSCNPGWARVAELACEDNKNCRAKPDQRVRPQPSETLAPLAFEANDAAEHNGHDQIECIVLKGWIKRRHHEIFSSLRALVVAGPRAKSWLRSHI